MLVLYSCRDSVVDKVTALRSGREESFDFRQRYEFFSTPNVRTSSGVHQASTQWVPGTPSLKITRPGRKSDHSPPFIACIETYLHS